MAKKKDTVQNISQEEHERVQQVLEYSHTLAQQLHIASQREQVEAALTEINTLSENAQIILSKSLAKERHTDAADVLLALNELGVQKSVRKEARRALIQLEGAKIYPLWSVPAAPQVVVVQGLEEDGAYRFWKGFVTDSIEVGEAQLILSFEREENPSTVRVLGFLLEFYHDGVKDAFTRVESKRSFMKSVDRMSAGLADVPLKQCSLVEGRELVLDALTINERYHTRPHRDYRVNLSLIQRLVLNASDGEEEGKAETSDAQDRGVKRTILGNLFVRKDLSQ